MKNTHQIYLISDSTGETLDRIFLAIKAQFKNIEYKVHTYSFSRTENQILKILSDAEKSAELNTGLVKPEFSSYSIRNPVPDFSGDPYTVIYNGRDYVRVAQWIENNSSRNLIVLICKKSKKPKLSGMWRLVNSCEIDQQPGVEIISQEIFHYSK